MTLFVDTTALYAAIDSSDAHHQRAAQGWAAAAERDEFLLTSNYVLLETVALLQRRMGLVAVRRLRTGFVPILDVHWVDADLHELSLGTLLTEGQRRLSLVDFVSFDVMRRLGLNTAFTFDAHFLQQGFRTFP